MAKESQRVDTKNAKDWVATDTSPANSSNAVARNQMLEINCSKMKLLDCNFSRNTSSSNCNFSKMFCSKLYSRKYVIGV
jgi:hypothetical protein